MNIQYFVNCTILYICKGFLKISVANCNNDDEMTNEDKYTLPDSRQEFAEGSNRTRVNALGSGIRRLDFSPKHIK